MSAKGKGKDVPVLNPLSTTPWRMGELRYSFTILDLGSRWRWVVSFTSRLLYTRGPFHRRLDGPQSRSGRRGVRKIFYPCQESNPGHPAVARRYTDWAIPTSKWRPVGLFTFRLRYPRGKSSRYILDRRLSGPQSRDGRCGEGIILSLPGIESDFTVVQFAA
jgi:hypothetical protein